jgi:hypothetical protein
MEPDAKTRQGRAETQDAAGIGGRMFSVKQKREIAVAVHNVLRATDHPELPKHPQEIQFELRVQGAKAWSWAYIRNNGAVDKPDVNPWNEMQDKRQ